ncbi:MAG: hypothetical protein ACREFK_01015 [Stellaceae bacterium]
MDLEEFSGSGTAQNFTPTAIIAALRAVQSGEIDDRTALLSTRSSKLMIKDSFR